MYSWLMPIVDVLAPLLTLLYQLTSDWGIAVILLTMFIRMLLFVFNLKAARQQLRQSMMMPKLLELRQKYEKDQNQLMQETLALYQKFGVKPMAMLWTGLIQFPVFMGLYALFISHGSMMTSLLIPWVTTLAQQDPWHLLPLVCGLLTLLSFLIPITSGGGATQSRVTRWAPPMIMTLLFVFIMWVSPVALGLYWTSNAFFALLERLFYRTPWGKLLLNKGQVHIAEGV